MIGYHFTGATLRDGRPIPPIGEWLEHTGPIVPCEFGLHMSEHPSDALTYAPGNLLHRVEMEGDIVAHGDPVDKYVGRRRCIIASVNAEKILRAFACRCALDVAHLWDAPAVVREYLETQDATKRDAAREAAWAAWAACDAAWDAASAAASATARDAAWAARAAARDAAWSAAEAAAKSPRDAAKATAWAAAKSTRAAARAATWAAAKSTRDAARAAQRARFQRMVEEAFLIREISE